MSWSDFAAGAIAGAVGVGLVALGLRDLRTRLVPVRPAQLLTVLALAGLGVVGLASGRWSQLAEAALAAVLVTGVQLLAYRVQGRRSADPAMGRADVRLSLPFGWTLGWFGVAFAVVGFLAALLSGLAATVLGRRRSVPFVPFLALGYWVGLAWVVARG